MKKIHLICAALILILSAASAFACSCVEYAAADREFAQAKNVILTRVTSLATVEVTKVYKGSYKKGQELAFLSGSMCDRRATQDDIGKDYLFYLWTNDGVATSSVCSRSGRTDWRVLDVSYLDDLDRVRGLSRLAGIVEQEFDVALESEVGRRVPLEGHTVRITGNGKDIRAKTDKNGLYQVYGLTPGQYRVEPERIKGYRMDASVGEKYDSRAVTVMSKTHTEASFSFEIDNSISGRLVDADGNPLAGVRIEALPAQGKARKYFINFTSSDKDGTFTIWNLPPGAYVIAGNAENKISEDYPYPIFYSSGSGDRASAQEITIGPGQHLKGFTVKASRPAEVVSIRGTLVYDDGTPATRASAKFLSTDGTVSYAYADQEGKFDLKVLKGKRGVIYGSLYPDEYAYRDCKEQLAAAKARSVIDDRYMVTPRREIEAVGATGVEIKFPFTLCKVR